MSSTNNEKYVFWIHTCSSTFSPLNNRTPRKVSDLASPATTVHQGRSAVMASGSPLPRPRAASTTPNGFSGLGISQRRPATSGGGLAVSASQPPATPPNRKTSQPNKDILNTMHPPPTAPSSGKKDQLNKESVNGTPLLSTPSTSKKIQPSKDSSNSKPLLSTPSSGKRTQTNRDITNSDERHNLEAQPPRKKQDQKSKEHIHVGHLLGSTDIKILANIDGEHAMYLVLVRGNI